MHSYVEISKKFFLLDVYLCNLTRFGMNVSLLFIYNVAFIDLQKLGETTIEMDFLSVV